MTTVTRDSAGRPQLRRRWATQTSLFQYRRPAFWLYAVVVVATGAYAISTQEAFHRISPGGWVLAWLLLLVYAVPVFAAVYLLDLYEREPVSLVLGALVWGAVAATTLAGIANEGWGLVVARVGGPEFAARWTAAFTAPWVEETLKGVGIVLVVLIAPEEIDDMMDGFVYGAMVGLGFAIVEDVFYFMGVFGGHPAGVLEGFYVRVLSSGLYGHVLYTGLAGMGIGYLVSRRGEVSKKRRALVAGGLIGAAMAAHFLWNSPLLDLFPSRLQGVGSWLLVPLAALVKGLPLVAFFVAMVWLARRREDRWLRVALSSETEELGLSRSEVEALGSPTRRRLARREMRARAGPGAAALLKRLQREQINLAMILTRARGHAGSDLERQRDYCRSLRDALMAIPGAAPAAGSGA